MASRRGRGDVLRGPADFKGPTEFPKVVWPLKKEVLSKADVESAKKGSKEAERE